MSFGAHAFIWTGDWTPVQAEKVIRSAAEAGLDFVEIPLLRPRDLDVSGTRELLDEHGIGCTCSLALPKEVHLPSAPEKAEEFLKLAVDVTAELGASILCGVLYAHLGTLTGSPPTEAELEKISRTLKSVAQYAGERGVSLGLEAVNRYETHLINLASQLNAMLDRINEPNVFAHLDTYHMNIEEKGFYDPIVSLGEKLRYIHLSESDRGTPGTGNVHWDEVFRGLKDIEYRGDLVMESFAAVNEDLAGATAIWRNVVDSPETLIRDGLTFLRATAIKHDVING